MNFFFCLDGYKFYKNYVLCKLYIDMSLCYFKFCWNNLCLYKKGRGLYYDLK